LEKQNVIKNQVETTGETETEEIKQENYNPLREHVQLEVEERVTCQVNKEGDISKFEVKGVIYLTLTDPK
jgi:hypothetical protein